MMIKVGRVFREGKIEKNKYFFLKEAKGKDLLYGAPGGVDIDRSLTGR